MGKIIVWLVVIFVILFALRMWNVAKAKSRSQGGARKAADGQAMVRCVRCGTFLPRPEATPTPEGFRCSDPACIQHPSGAR